MQLIGKLKNKVDQAASKEEARELIEQAGMKLTDEELDKVKLTDDELNRVAGGVQHVPCPYNPTCTYAFTERCLICPKR